MKGQPSPSPCRSTSKRGTTDTVTKILLVDDEPDAITTLKFRFEQAGYEVLTAENGMQALDALRESPVDLVLADFMMPELNGIEMARMIKGSSTLFDTRIMLVDLVGDLSHHLLYELR